MTTETITLQEVANAQRITRQAIHRRARRLGLATTRDNRGRVKLLRADVERHWPDLFTPEAHASREIAHVIDALTMQVRGSGAMSMDQFALELRNTLAAMITGDGRLLKLFIAAIGGGPQYSARGLERVTAMLKIGEAV